MKVNKLFILSVICFKEWVIYYHFNMVDQLHINKVKIEKKILKKNFNHLQKKLIQLIVLNF